MKQIIFHRISLFLTVFFAVVWTATLAFEGYRIKIHIEGQADTECYLAYHFGNRQYLKDTAYVNLSGEAVFQGPERLTPGIYLVVLEDDINFELIIDENQFFELSVDPADPVASLQFVDSPENIEFYAYIRFLRGKGAERQALERELNTGDLPPARQTAIRQRLQALDAEVTARQDEIIEKNPDALLSRIILGQRDPEMPDPPLLPDGSPDRARMYQIYKKHFFDNFDFSDDRILQTPVYHSRLRIFFNNVLMQIPDSIIKEADRVIEKSRANEEMFRYTVWFITNNAESSPVMGMDAVFVHMVENYYVTGEVDWLDEERRQRIIQRAMEMKPLLLGKVAPDISIYDPDGNALVLHEVEAAYLILYFWDSECVFCRKARPVIEAAYENLRDRGVRVFSVNTEADADKWRNVIAGHKHNWYHGNDPENESGFRDKYNIFAIPKIFVLDAEKRIIAKDIGAEHLEQFLLQHMATH